jgi:hypothetical protein
MHANVYRIATGLVIAALLAGAGIYLWKGRHTVSGHVTYNGAPLDKAGGTVVFVAPDGTQTPASISADGSYRASNVPSGLNRIAVYYPDLAVQSMKKRRPPPGELPPVRSPFLTPLRYAAVETSELEVDVGNDMVFNIELIGPPIP